MNTTETPFKPDQEYGLFINNQWVNSEIGRTIESRNPANGEFITRIPDATAGDIDRAVQAATQAFESWKKTTVAQRSLALLKIAD